MFGSCRNQHWVSFTLPCHIMVRGERYIVEPFFGEWLRGLGSLRFYNAYYQCGGHSVSLMWLLQGEEISL